MDSFDYKDVSIKYSIKYTNRKTIGITIDLDGRVVVSAPNRLSKDRIEEVLMQKASWIENKLKLVQERNKHIRKSYLGDGEGILFLGKTYIIKIHKVEKGAIYITLDDDKCNIFLDKTIKEQDVTNVITRAIKKFYISQAKIIFKDRIGIFSQKLEVSPNKITIKEVKTIWGSCSSRKNISLSWKLIMAPEDIIDYVVVHELCHLKHMNHSKDFWEEVEKVMLDYKDRRKYLKQNGHLYKLD